MLVLHIMPKRKPSPTSELSAEELQPELPRDMPSKYRAKISIPITDDGRLDATRIKDPAVLDRARVALGVDSGVNVSAVEPQKMVPREMIPFIYDGLAAAFRIGVRAFKWPKVATPEERAEFVSYMEYSADFKEKATEPTAALLDKLGTNSRLMRWFAANQEAAVVLFLVYSGTMEMFAVAGQKFAYEKLKREQADAINKGKANGGFPASENRGPIAVGSNP